jgi:hypothetical protein
MKRSRLIAAVLLLSLGACFPAVVAGQGTRPLGTGAAAAPEQPTAPAAVARGMKKEQVRTLWGEPVAVRKIRTCFGIREEWVYRGDPQRYGGEERTLLFDEGDVLDEIK